MFALRWTWAWIGLLAIVVCLVDLAMTYPRLPPQVATHFNAAGQPDAWGTREQYVGELLLLFATIVFVTMMMPVMVWVLPMSLLNVPDADYWKAPARIEATREMVIHRTGWLACATLLLMVGVMRILMHANLQPQPGLNGLMTAIVAYFVFVAVWLGEIIWRFGIAKKQKQ